MLALSPPVFSPIEWPLDESMSTHNTQNLIYRDLSGDHVEFISEPLHHQVGVEEVQMSAPISPASSDPNMVKKLNHNASERDRRKKINSMYSSLRSMLPLPDQTKKLSIPATISRVLKYIPELQQQVEGLIKKKEELLLRISRQGDAATSKDSRTKTGLPNSACVVSTSRLSDSEALIQISSDKVHKTPLSQILLCLEKQGLLLLNASSFQTFGHRVFYNLHFQMERTCRLESDILSEKILAIYEKEEGGFNVSKYDDQIISVL